MATERASFGSFLFECPEPNSLTLDASVAGTSTTCSPAEVAAAMRVSRGTVASALAVARRRLASWLTEEEASDD